MSETQDYVAGSNTYEVTVGLAKCTVSGQTEKDAVTRAREELNRQMPHMTSVIYGINDNKFRVDQVR
ncbi:MAG TPA: hypothetical protein VE890_11675 [Thermoguttaceae bacterium]|nr:hypothetical protein [Thermoguttaceae bacterium]